MQLIQTRRLVVSPKLLYSREGITTIPFAVSFTTLPSSQEPFSAAIHLNVSPHPPILPPLSPPQAGRSRHPLPRKVVVVVIITLVSVSVGTPRLPLPLIKPSSPPISLSDLWSVYCPSSRKRLAVRVFVHTRANKPREGRCWLLQPSRLHQTCARHQLVNWVQVAAECLHTNALEVCAPKASPSSRQDLQKWRCSQERRCARTEQGVQIAWSCGVVRSAVISQLNGLGR